MSNFTVYRKTWDEDGQAYILAEAFKIESRQQGQIRKMQTATYHEEIMTDDSIKIQLLSINRIDFRLRDFIIYDDRPYFLNRLPQCSIDTTGRYVYDITFEGVMYELGRVAFIMPDAFGYQYYGPLSDFARLIADNMNRINASVVWEYGGDTYEARYKDEVEITHGDTTYRCKRWGVGFNHDLEDMCVTWIITEGMPSVGSHPIDPEDGSEVDFCTITDVRKWDVDFQTAPSSMPTYPSAGSGVVPDATHVLRWPNPNTAGEDAFIEEEDYKSMLRAMQRTEYSNYITDPDNPSDKMATWKKVYEVAGLDDTPPDIEVGDLPVLTDFPSFIGDKREVTNSVSYTFRCTDYSLDLDPTSSTYMAWVSQGYSDSPKVLNYKATYNAIDTVSNEWMVTQIEPGSGTTSSDYPTEFQLLEYDCHSCLAVLQDISAQWDEWEWVIDNVEHGLVQGEILVWATIKIRQRNVIDAGGETHSIGFGKSGGLSMIRRKYADESNPPSRIYFYGGRNNLPQYYRNERLCLPNRAKKDSYLDFDAFQQSLFPLGVSNGTCEAIVNVDDIYPANEPFVVKEGWARMVHSQDPDTHEPIPPHYLELAIPEDEFFFITDIWKPYDFDNEDLEDCTDYLEWLTLKQWEDTQEHREHYEKHYAGDTANPKHVSKYMIGGEAPMFTFQGGELEGYQLSMYRCFRDDGNIVVWLNVIKEENEEKEGYYVPNDTDRRCLPGDKFIIDNINMPVAYTYYRDGESGDFSAENRLWKAAIDYMNDMANKIDYEVEVARDYVIKHGESFSCFDTLMFPDRLSAELETIKRRIIEVERDLIDGYSYKLTITNRGMIRPWKNLGKIINQQNTTR